MMFMPRIFATVEIYSALLISSVLSPWHFIGAAPATLEQRTILWPTDSGRRINKATDGHVRHIHFNTANETCVSTSGLPGTCSPYSECRHDWNGARDGPVLCGWKAPGSLEPLVCCPIRINETRGDAVIKAKEWLIETKNDCGCVRKPENETCPKRAGPPGPQVTRYVTGGLPATPGDFPWMALIGQRLTSDTTEWSCGGSLLSSRYVLTSATCAEYFALERLVVRLGEHDLTTADEAPSDDFGVSRIFVHPAWKPPSRYHNLALLKLERKTRFNSHIRPICLPMTDLSDATIRTGNPSYIVIGWGTDELGAKALSNVLKSAALPIIESGRCNEIYQDLFQGTSEQSSYPDGVTNDLICAGVEGNSACQGDGGGPLVQEGTNQDTGDAQYTVVGVVSQGPGCGSPYPGFYIRVDRYLDWIQQTIADDGNFGSD